MLIPLLELDDVKNPGKSVSIPADPRASVMPGPAPDTVIILTSDGQSAWVVGTVEEIQRKIETAAHSGKNGDAPRGQVPAG